jgi:hypothetical protein
MAHYWVSEKVGLLLPSGKVVLSGQQIPDGAISDRRLRVLVQKWRAAEKTEPAPFALRPRVEVEKSASEPAAELEVEKSVSEPTEEEETEKPAAAGPLASKRGPGRPRKAKP